MLFDPGRIKRGLASLAEAGPAMEQGHAYTLVVDRAWLDARGAPLAEEYRKEFRAGPADRTPPDPGKWSIAAPRAGSIEPLVIRFPEPLDFAMLQHELQVTGASGKVSVGRGETEWRFTPDHPWRAATYSVVVNTRLEDMAGNQLNRPFDVDTFDPITPKVMGQTVTLRVRVR
ncbi:MAG: Ig-like domain-containing protein [Paludibaculum sp.]